MPSNRPYQVHVVVFDGVEEQDFVGPLQIFAAAVKIGTAIETRLVTTGEPGTVVAAYRTRLLVETGWSPEAADLLVVPGGGYHQQDAPGVWAELRSGVLPKALATARRPGLTIASVCTGAMLLSAAGLTEGRPCTTHHMAKKDLADQGGLVRDARVVDDGDLVTSGGITSGLDLALWLVQREFGSEPATSLELMTEYERRGVVWRHAAS